MVLSDRIRFHSSTAYDFLFLPYKARNYSSFLVELSEPPLNGKIEPDETVRNWVELINDITDDKIDELMGLFFDEEAFFGLCLIQDISLNDIPDSKTFMEYLSDLPPREILRRFLYSGYGPRGGTIIADELLGRLLRNESELLDFVSKRVAFPARQKAILFEFFSDPEEMKVKYQYLLEWFYNEFFSDFEARIKKNTSLLLRDYEAFLREGGEKSLAKICWFDSSSDEIPNHQKITIAVAFSLEAERANASLPESNELLIICGSKFMERLRLEKDPVLRAIEVFKALSDTRRIDLLRILSKKPHTGNELVDVTNLTNTVISHGIMDLRAAGLVKHALDERGMTVYRTDRKLVEDRINESLKTVFGEK